jgi:hypothetical protein
MIANIRDHEVHSTAKALRIRTRQTLSNEVAFIGVPKQI